MAPGLLAQVQRHLCPSTVGSLSIHPPSLLKTPPSTPPSPEQADEEGVELGHARAELEPLGGGQEGAVRPQHAAVGLVHHRQVQVREHLWHEAGHGGTCAHARSECTNGRERPSSRARGTTQADLGCGTHPLSPKAAQLYVTLRGDTRPPPPSLHGVLTLAAVTPAPRVCSADRGRRHRVACRGPHDAPPPNPCGTRGPVAQPRRRPWAPCPPPEIAEHAGAICTHTAAPPPRPPCRTPPAPC